MTRLGALGDRATKRERAIKALLFTAETFKAACRAASMSQGEADEPLHRLDRGYRTLERRPDVTLDLPSVPGAGADAEVVLDIVLDPVIILRAVRDETGRVVDFLYEYANEAACAYGCIAHEDLIGQRLRARFPDRTEAGLFRHLAGVAEAGRPLSLHRWRSNRAATALPAPALYELRARRCDGCTVVTWRDVSDLDRAEVRDQLQARLLDEVDAAIIATDSGFRIDYWSSGATRLYGWDREEVLGKQIEEVLRPFAPEKEVPATHAEMRRGALETEFLLARKDGSRVDVLVRTMPQWGEEIFNGVVGVSVDISAQKAAERELREAAEYLQTVADNMAEGLLALDESGRLTFLNAAAGRLLGWPVEELTGKLMHETIHFERIDGTRSPSEACPLVQTRTIGRPVHSERDVFIRRDGTHLPVAYSSSPLRSGSVGGAVLVFSDITARIGEQLRLERELDKLAWVGRIQDALEQDRFVLYAQPIIDLKTDAVVQHELLIRMKGSNGELILPDVFLPAAEEFGLIDRIDRWVVRESARLAISGHAVEFNLSARSVGNVEMLHTLQEVLATGAPPEHLVCEITETALMNDSPAGEDFVRALRDLGCKVALDDFGTGFGGLAYLKRLPLSYLKIDIQFVRDLVREPTSQHVIRAIVSLAHGFGLETIAEGAEDFETVELLKDLQVDYAQGYYFARPGPLEEMFPLAAIVAK